MICAELLKVGNQIEYTKLRDYLIAHGWQAKHSKRSDIGIFCWSATGTEVLVPLVRDFADYGEAIITAARIIADVEQRTALGVIYDL